LGKRLISPQYYVANTVWRSNWSAGEKKGCAVMKWNAFDVDVLKINRFYNSLYQLKI
jgi:hypothetical protein